MNTSVTHLVLRDIHMPEPISWWPPALGWWGVGGLALMVCLLVALWWRRFQGRRLRKVALRALDDLEAAYRMNREGGLLIVELSALLRRVCLALSDRRVQSAHTVWAPGHDLKVAGLTGEAWLSFLEQDMPGQPFTKGPGRLLISLPFQRMGEKVTYEREREWMDLLALCRAWLRVMPLNWPRNFGPVTHIAPVDPHAS